MYYLSDSSSLLFISGCLLLALLIDFGRNKVLFIKKIFNYTLKPVTRSYETNFLSASYMIISFFFITLFFETSIIITAMILSIVADTTAALFGMKIGKVKLFYSKTLEGSYIFFLTSYLILYFSNIDLSNFHMIIIAFLTMFVELLSPTKFDNFTLPIATSLLIYILL
tara:strand:- start:86 stop:589 length:504 start_codon:yes stop_codon:yes gene_type:complete